MALQNKGAICTTTDALESGDNTAITTQIATAVNDLMIAHGMMRIASDMGDCLFTATEIGHTELVAPGYYATMGYGVPAGRGVHAAPEQRPLILVGDGPFQMTGWELGNCRRYGSDPIVLLFNNASWEMLRTFQPESSFKIWVNGDLPKWPPDWAATALRRQPCRVVGGARQGAGSARAFPVDRGDDSARSAVDYPAAICRRGKTPERDELDGRTSVVGTTVCRDAVAGDW